MAYHTPELLLVGAAQNLVLGIYKSMLGSAGNHDFDGHLYHQEPFGIADGARW